MLWSLPKPICVALATFLLAPAPPNRAPAFSHQKNVWNYDGGFYFISDGDIAGGPCFRISGRVTAKTMSEPHTMRHRTAQMAWPTEASE